MNMITTFTGKHLNPMEPDKEAIDILDIAHALSLICRGNGQVKTFFSVGQHCIHCALEAQARGYSDRVILACLLHDASECYMSDVPSPFKMFLKDYQETEEKLLNIIYEKFLGETLSGEEAAHVNEVDKDMLYYDLKELLGEVLDRDEPQMKTDFSYQVLPFEAVEQRYLELFYQYSQRKNNPWEEIDLNDYENHMRLDSVAQLQALDKMMKSQFDTYSAKTVMVLGVAGGNGLRHIDKNTFQKVYGVDINQNYLSECEKRYPKLKEVLRTVCVDLTKDVTKLPGAELLIADLLIEYIGYSCFQEVVRQVKPRIVSCIIQINTDMSFVSDSPYIHVFDRLEEVHCQIEEKTLQTTMREIGYQMEQSEEYMLPNGKKLVRLDFSCSNQ